MGKVWEKVTKVIRDREKLLGKKRVNRVGLSIKEENLNEG